jgi:hypothetical protein
LDTANTVFIIYLLWYYVIDQFGLYAMTTNLVWQFPAQIIAAVSLCHVDYKTHSHFPAYSPMSCADLDLLSCANVRHSPQRRGHRSARSAASTRGAFGSVRTSVYVRIPDRLTEYLQ